MALTVTYNGQALHTFASGHGVVVGDVDYGSSPDTTINILALAKTPRSTITSALKQQKTITVTGTIVGTNFTDCTTQIRTYNGYLIGKEQTLNINDGTTSINYTCTVNKNVVKQPNNLSFASFTTTFICSKPYGEDTSATTVLNQTGRINGSYSDAITVGGTSEWQTPVITITLTAATGTTGQFINIGNSLTGQSCKVTRNWNNADILVIDTSSITHSVQVNGTDVVFTGALPVFNPSTYIAGQTITYNDSFSTRTMTENVTNINRWD